MICRKVKVKSPLLEVVKDSEKHQERTGGKSLKIEVSDIK